jgi:chaperonin GroES
MIVPILHRVLVKVDEVETKTASGIVLAVNEKREQAAAETGVVISIGDTAFKDFKAEVVPNIGDKVYFAKYAGKVVKDVDGTEYTVLNDEDIIGVIK